MKGRQIRIDWDELESAFNNKNEELVYYLDTVTGHVHLEGEGEDDYEDDDDGDVRPPTASTRDDTQIRIPSPERAVVVGWMEEFIAGDSVDSAVGAALTEALEAEAPVPAVQGVLAEHDEVRDAWFGFRSEKIRELMGAWLSDNDVRPIDPPPWAD